MRNFNILIHYFVIYENNEVKKYNVSFNINSNCVQGAILKLLNKIVITGVITKIKVIENLENYE